MQIPYIYLQKMTCKNNEEILKYEKFDFSFFTIAEWKIPRDLTLRHKGHVRPSVLKKNVISYVPMTKFDMDQEKVKHNSKMKSKC